MTKPEITDAEALEQAKNKRQQKKGRPSKTKPKGSPVVGRQAETLFGAPNGNTPGLTSKQKLLAYRASELAAELSVDFLEEIKGHVDRARAAGNGAEAIQALTTNALALMRDAMDRSFGKAQSSVDLTSNGETVNAPTQIQLVAVRPKNDS